MAMIPEIKTKFLAALRSGEYKQGTGMLFQLDAKGCARYCCMGVLDAIQGRNFHVASPLSLVQGSIPNKRAGLTEGQCIVLAGMNDHGNTFPKIADYVEAHF